MLGLDGRFASIHIKLLVFVKFMLYSLKNPLSLASSSSYPEKNKDTLD